MQLLMEIQKIWNSYWKKFPYNALTFADEAKNGKIENMKWLLENKFPHDFNALNSVVKNGKHKMVIKK
jgi:hypothetical protein